MEEYDELSAGPNKEGVLDLSHNAWAELPDQLFNFASRILTLDLSHNKLVEVEADFGKLFVLSHLNLEGNMITQIHPNLGKCVRLKSINLSQNRIGEIPPDIGNCTLLEEFRCTDNFITTLPPTFGNIVALRILDLKNNKLSFLPPEIAKIPTITEIHCEENDDLSMVPDDMRVDSDMVIWALRLHRDHQAKVEVKVAHYEELEEKARESEETRLRLKDEMSTILEEVKTLEESRPTTYINFKAKTRRLAKKIRCTVS
ncbi:hypothetical protein TrVE_jg9357 [Triparma verrucosa]|uniref:Uncharacterized protein n=3 Tax=Triparma TaxID=722752 RepID=A0A9W7BAQ8_9STRA|nr:hypothetical protein TrVE_jg9357 [Triparma verrucosa]GMH87476.1 hypothetical protein TrST_g13282 [Triparma strigata]